MTEKQSNNQKLEGKLVESLEVKELGDLVTEYSELGLDSILDDGIVKDVPILRTIIGIAKVGLNFRDRIYIKKIAVFLAQVGKTTQEQREGFIKKYCKNTKRFEEAVLLILEQADSMEKSTLIGKIFKACILGKITYIDAMRLSEMVNRSFWRDLERLFEKTDRLEHWPRLYTAGLYRITGGQLHFDNHAEFKYEKNDYAKALIMIHEERFDDLWQCAIGVVEERE